MLQHTKHMRSDPTKAEAALWRRLRDNAIEGAHFRRQVPRGPYIVDFCSSRLMLIVEVDGGHHGGARDEERDRDMRGRGYTVLRFWNNEVLANMEGVLEAIRTAVREASNPTLPT